MHYVAIISIWGFGLVQLAVGFMGIQFHLGVIWAAIALLAALVFRFTLPITIGSFFGAMSVWGVALGVFGSVRRSRFNLPDSWGHPDFYWSGEEISGLW